MQTLTYEETVTAIENKRRFGNLKGVEISKIMLEKLGHPEKDLRIIHIAGTNGKGSVSAFLRSVFECAGLKTGMFTSPHLVDFRERIQVQGDMISKADTTRLGNRLLSMDFGVYPTMFDYCLAMALLYFKEQQCDVVILETGLGGRLDATTAVENPVACVITSISFDHMQYLGNTIEEIAGEKAGIIVPGVPVIYDGNDQKAAKVIRERAQELNSPCYEVTREDTEIIRNTCSGIDFSFKNEYYGNTVFSIPFIALYQVMNSSLALKTIEVLKDQVKIPVEAVRKGLLETRWQGRMETVLPGVIVDGAHNEDGVEKFVETAVHFQKDYPLTLLFSAVDDKDYTDMIRTILGKISFHHVIVTQVGGYRKVPAEKLAEIFREKGCPTAEACEDVEEAFKKALAAKGEDGMLFCVGSLYLVGEIKTLILQGVGK